MARASTELRSGLPRGPIAFEVGSPHPALDYRVSDFDSEIATEQEYSFTAAVLSSPTCSSFSGVAMRAPSGANTAPSL